MRVDTLGRYDADSASNEGEWNKKKTDQIPVILWDIFACIFFYIICTLIYTDWKLFWYVAVGATSISLVGLPAAFLVDHHLNS